MTRIFTLFAVLFLIQFGFSQTSKSLNQNQHVYVHGNSVLVGNNILGHHASKPMLENDVANDMVKMKYIDVDDDKRTFSSSEATITDIPAYSQIKYAALYWSALYPYEKGILRAIDGKARYLERGERNPEINKILFRIPGQDYQPIVGEILNDTYGDKDFESTAPYVCRADVTEMLQQLENANGVYTVGNVRATEGKVAGGGSAGWLLYVVYENEQESLKYFTNYDGLIEVDRNVVDIPFSGFRSKQEGRINPTLGVAALEGDRKIRTDQMLLYSDKTDEFVAMGNEQRSAQNFFNSSITIGNSVYEGRNPNSSNTLGFDLLKFDIPNEGNRFFDANTTATILRFQTRADRFYLFFVSFEIEMERDALLAMANGIEKATITQNNHTITSDNRLVISDSEKHKPVDPKIVDEVEGDLVIADNSEDADDSTLIAEDFVVGDVTPERDAKNHIAENSRWSSENRDARYLQLSEAEIADLKNEIMHQEGHQISGYRSGYYLVTNVFKYRSNGQRWRDFLTKKGYTPETIINPENNWEYIYTESFDNLNDGFEAWQREQSHSYFSGLWLMKISEEDGLFTVLFSK